MLPNGSYSFPSPLKSTQSQTMVAVQNTDGKLSTILGHIGIKIVKRATELPDSIYDFDILSEESHECIWCIDFGSQRKSLSHTIPRNTNQLERTYTDISRKSTIAEFMDYNTARKAA